MLAASPPDAGAFPVWSPALHGAWTSAPTSCSTDRPPQPAPAPSVAASPSQGRPRSPCSSTDSSPAGDEPASMGDKADWSDGFLTNLFDACKEEIEAGNRPMGIFTATGWKNVVSKFADKSGDRRTKKQLKNKIYILKKDYTVFMEFKNCATRLGWDVEKKTVDCPKEWWDEHLARCKNPEKRIKCSHMKFRKHGPKFLEDMHIIFGKAHVDGSTAACPGDISSDDTSDEDVAEVPKPTT